MNALGKAARKAREMCRILDEDLGPDLIGLRQRFQDSDPALADLAALQAKLDRFFQYLRNPIVPDWRPPPPH